jgi:hypothetical protein
MYNLASTYYRTFKKKQTNRYPNTKYFWQLSASALNAKKDVYIHHILFHKIDGSKGATLHLDCTLQGQLIWLASS